MKSLTKLADFATSFLSLALSVDTLWARTYSQAPRDRRGFEKGMTKAELIDRVAARKDIPRGLTKKAVAQIVDAAFLEIGDYFIRARIGRTPARLTYPGFGTFTKRKKNARTVRNPQTGEPLLIPTQATVSFAPSQDLKSLMNELAQPKRARR